MSVDDRDGRGDNPEDELNLEQLSDEIIQRYSPDRLLKSISKRAGRGEPLDWTTRNRFERKLGVDLGDVRIYTGEVARSVTRSKGAEALTVGTTKAILMGGSGDQSPLSASGRGLLAHELTHVAQDKKRLHPKSVGETTGPFTLEDEVEAEQMAAEEAAAHDMPSSGAVQSKRGLTEAEYMDVLRESTIMRVLELMNEDHRIMRMRKGKTKFRP